MDKVCVSFFQPQMQLCSLCPASAVTPSAIVLLICVVSVPRSVTMWSADESSCTPALADSGDIFSLDVFVAMVGWTQLTVRWLAPADMGS